MMRDIFLGIQLFFETESERRESEDFLRRLLGLISRANYLYRLRYPQTLRLYDTEVIYKKPDQIDRPPIDKKKLKQLFTLLQSMNLRRLDIEQIFRIVQGVEIFLDIPTLYREKAGDCNILAPVRVAELWQAGVNAGPYMTKRQVGNGFIYHAFLTYLDDNSYEDPSLILGMGGSARAIDRKEEIRKNYERQSNAIEQGALLIQQGYDPNLIMNQINTMGFVPSSGKFREVY